MRIVINEINHEQASRIEGLVCSRGQYLQQTGPSRYIVMSATHSSFLPTADALQFVKEYEEEAAVGHLEISF